MLSGCSNHVSLFNREHVFLPDDPSDFYLEERDPFGAGKAFFSCSSPCVVVRPSANGPLLWSLKEQGRTEGAIITHDSDGYHLHLVEMKSGLGQKQWSDAICQFKGMLLTTLATIRLLGILQVSSVTCYIAFKRDKLAPTVDANPVLAKTFVGMPNPIGGMKEWISNEIELPIFGAASVRKAQRDASNDVNFGPIRS